MKLFACLLCCGWVLLASSNSCGELGRLKLKSQWARIFTSAKQQDEFASSMWARCERLRARVLVCAYVPTCVCACVRALYFVAMVHNSGPLDYLQIFYLDSEIKHAAFIN